MMQLKTADLHKVVLSGVCHLTVYFCAINANKERFKPFTSVHTLLQFSIAN